MLDKEKHIFKSRKYGGFVFDPKTRDCAPSSFVDDTVRKNHKELLVLDFGDAFFLDRYMRKIGLFPSVEAIGYDTMDSLKAMILYTILTFTGNRHAEDWYNGSFARFLYPEATLSSQGISDMLSCVGSENSMRRFFSAYLTLAAKRDEGTDILIDGTGRNEVRLICVVEQKTTMPLYFRCVRGSVVDVSTLVATLKELKASHVNTKFAILDAGYLSDENIRELCDANISFVSRLHPSSAILQKAVKDHFNKLVSRENMVVSNSRVSFIKRLPVEIDSKGDKGYLYHCRNIPAKAVDSPDLFKKDPSTTEDTMGVFGLISSRKMEVDRVLTIYEARRQMEDVFDGGKAADLLPLNGGKEEAFRGHLLLAFIAAVLVKHLQDDLKDTEYSPVDAWMNLRNPRRLGGGVDRKRRRNHRR